MLSKIQITLTRNSVCMGDDLEDHTKIINIRSQRNMQKTIINIAKNYLPNITGCGHSWDCYLDGTKIAVINGNCNEITLTADCPSLKNGCEFFFKYNSASY
ncbi:MAG: hypothetical protein A2Y17_02345 [Clostridiales bacterium GWF2_38_85]|nr:MAG: hypothetical protein A2Y17_02345 [Clostridiales bacterium GWF2_38_85]HBL85038.1 hypothetical protein [Clostridiales bacterium]